LRLSFGIALGAGLARPASGKRPDIDRVAQGGVRMDNWFCVILAGQSSHTPA